MFISWESTTSSVLIFTIVEAKKEKKETNTEGQFRRHRPTLDLGARKLITAGSYCMLMAHSYNEGQMDEGGGR